MHAPFAMRALTNCTRYDSQVSSRRLSSRTTSSLSPVFPTGGGLIESCSGAKISRIMWQPVATRSCGRVTTPRHSGFSVLSHVAHEQDPALVVDIRII